MGPGTGVLGGGRLIRERSIARYLPGMDITQGSPPGVRQHAMKSAYGALRPDPGSEIRNGPGSVLARASLVGGDSVELSEQRPLAVAGAKSLVAARVDRPVSFEAPEVAAAPGPLPAAPLALYRHSAAEHAVATDLAVGRLIDAQA